MRTCAFSPCVFASVCFFFAALVIHMSLSWNISLHLPNRWNVLSHVCIIRLKKHHSSWWNMKTSYLVSCKTLPVVQKLLWTWKLVGHCNDSLDSVCFLRDEIMIIKWMMNISVLIWLAMFIWLLISCLIHVVVLSAPNREQNAINNFYHNVLLNMVLMDPIRHV